MADAPDPRASSLAAQIARNQAIFRAVNDAIAELADRLESAVEERQVGFICECGDGACLEPLPLTLEEYEGVRVEPRSFVVAPGHEARDLERVVEERAGYYIVTKTHGASASVLIDAQ